MDQIQYALSIGLLCVAVAGCAPPVGSEAWCKQMKARDAGDWTANEAADYTKHCLFQKN